VSESLCDTVKSVDIIDSGVNLSDHCALLMDLTLSVERCGRRKEQGKPRAWHYSYRWDKADLSRYYAASSAYMHAVSVPVHLLNVDSSDTTIREDIQLSIDCFYRSIVYIYFISP